MTARFWTLQTREFNCLLDSSHFRVVLLLLWDYRRWLWHLVNSSGVSCVGLVCILRFRCKWICRLRYTGGSQFTELNVNRISKIPQTRVDRAVAEKANECKSRTAGFELSFDWSCRRE